MVAAALSGIPDQRGGESQKGERLGLSGIALDGGSPDRIAIGIRLSDAVFLEYIENGRIAVRDSVDSLGQEMRAEPIVDGFAHQPETILGQPAVGVLGLVQPEHLPDEVLAGTMNRVILGLRGAFPKRRQGPAVTSARPASTRRCAHSGA